MIALAALSSSAKTVTAFSDHDLVDAATRADRERILLASARDGDLDLYLIRRNGRDVSAVTRNDVDDERAVLSADGRTIAYTGPGLGLYVARSDGSRARRLGSYSSDYALSRTGGRIAFVKDSTSLWVSRTDRTAGATLLRQWQFAIDDLSWSPDGRWIAYARITKGYPKVEDALELIRPDGTGLRRLARTVSSTPYWSPDGRSIAFVRDDDLMIVQTAAGTERRLTSAFGASPLAWSPDGRALAFGDKGGLFTIPAGGGPRRRIAQLQPYGLTHGLSWSRDAKTIAFQAANCGGIYVVPSMGGKPKRLPGPKGCDTSALYEELVGWAVAIGGKPAEESPRARPLYARVLAETRPVDAIAADRDLVAVLRKGTGTIGCGLVSLWHPPSRSLVALGQEARDCGSSDEPSGLDGVALAGERALWLRWWDTNRLWSTFFVATRSKPTPRELDNSLPLDNYAALFAGDDDLIVFRVAERSIATARSRRFRVIARAPAKVLDLAVDSGRIAVLTAANDVLLLDRYGRSLRHIAIAGEARELALQGERLVVLAHARGGAWRLAIHDVLTGRRRSTIRLRGRELSLADADGGIAVLVVGRQLRFVRLGDGRRAVLPVPGSGSVLVELEASGVFYTYDLPRARLPARVAFVPFAEIVRRLR